MKIFIDGDGCPVINEVVAIGKKYDLDIILVKNYHHEFNIPEITIITVDFTNDSADYYIVNHIGMGDVLVTQDYGLMAMALAKKSFCINQNGVIVSEENISEFLERRHQNKKMMKKGIYKSKFKKRNSDDDFKFSKKFEDLLKSLSNQHT